MQSDAFVFMGGTFDPIHNGHLRTALEIRQWMGVEQVCLIPSKTPVHRAEPGRTSEQRFEMVRLAVAGENELCADDREISSVKASYSLYTLQSLRQEMGADRPICMVMGMDSYQTLTQWYEWERFTDYAHLIVVKRPGYEQPKDQLLTQFTNQHKVECLAEVLSQPAGKVLFHELTPLGISATQIRETIARGESPRYLFPDAVWQYIQDNRLYGLTN
ncbi:nicotinate-nucleotide adenylyltransferase [uncultured Neptuniibacter sp.]|uniref:nicotinate-nucleotide adenylyltransferase n=1 Tax=uncultured Neptuniibacter sp. TaxID=502143 RepID=UPI00262ADB09|nr:nicotinate-nucleotide adenylyltransferase [uncultured Neptuniibacter sp.]